MNLTSCLFRWSWLLGIALWAPIGLPAGGGELNQAKFREREDFDPFFAGPKCILQKYPLSMAPSIQALNVGTPIKILHRWKAPDGGHWLYVQATSEMVLIGSNHFRERGWINV